MQIEFHKMGFKFHDTILVLHNCKPDPLKCYSRKPIPSFWHFYVYETFSNVNYTKKDAFKRKRDLINRFKTTTSGSGILKRFYRYISYQARSEALAME